MPISSGCAAWWAATSASARARRAASTSAARRQSGPARRAPWRSRRARSEPTGAAASAAARSGVSRRREIPRGGDGSSTTPPPATAPGEGRRRANRSPGAAAMAASRRRIATEVPSSRSMASRGPRTTSASACAVPRWRRRRSRSAGRSAGVLAGPRMATRILDVATTPGSVVRTCPRRRRSPSIPPTSRAVRPPATVVTGAPRTWTSRTRSGSSPGTSRSVIPVVTAPPRRLPVTTVPRPLTANTRSIARRGPCASAAASRAPRRRASAADGLQHAVDPRAARRGRREDRRPGERRRREQGADLGLDRREARLVDQVGLRHDGEPVADPERVEEPEVLERLRVRAVVGGDHQQRGVDLARADQHVADEAVVPRHVDEVDDRPVRQRDVRVADVDRHPAPPLLGEAVGVDAGQRPEQARLAVVDVPGGPDDHAPACVGHRPLRHRRPAPPVSPPTSAASSVGSTERRSSSTARAFDPSDHGRGSGTEAGEQPVRLGARQAHGSRRQHLARQGAAADRGLDRRDAGARSRRLGDRRGPRAQRLDRCRDLAPDGDVARGDAGAVQGERGGDRGEDDLVRPHRPRQRVLPESRDEVGAADDEPGLGPADELVAAERHEVRPVGQPLARHRLVGQPERRGVEQRAAAEVVDHERAEPVCGRRQGAGIRRLDEPGLAEVRRVDPKHQPRPAVLEGRLEVACPRPVRRPDLDQLRARAPHDLRDPDATADLDELAAAHGHAAPPRQADGERDGRRVVGDDQRVLGAGRARRGAPRPPGSGGLAGRWRGRARGTASRCARPRGRPGSRPRATARDRGWCGR